MTKTHFSGVLLCLLFFSCNKTPKPDLEKEKAEILRLEALQREYHFQKNAADFVKMFSKDFVSLNRGMIGRPTAAENFDRFSRYFGSVEFVKWDDVNPPLVRISDDASVAYSILDKLVILKMKDESGAEIMDTTHFAWMTVYKKENAAWKIDAVSSTNR